MLESAVTYARIGQHIRGIPPITLFRALACAAGCLFFSIGASADDIDMKSVFHEISIGVLDHDTDNLWSGFSRESGADINFEALFSPSYEILGGAIRPAVGASINTSGDTSKLYAGARWRYEFEQGIFVGIGLGAAVHNGDTDLKSVDKKALGSKVLFHIPLEAGYRFNEHYSASIYFDHVSNASLANANEGLDTLGFRLGYRF
jgi:hypothetical protein